MKTIIDFFFNRLKALKSLRFLIFILLFIVGIIPSVLISESVIKNYKSREISLRTTEVVDQGRILATRLDSEGYLVNPDNPILENEMMLLTGIYDGRIMITDGRFLVIYDTYGLASG